MTDTPIIRLLPRVQAPKPAAIPPGALCGCHALIAEDNPLNRVILGKILSIEGITYEEVEDGVAAVRAFLTAPVNAFDFILMDIRMPRLDGIETASLIRASGRPDAVTVPIIGISAAGFPDDIRRARLAGIDEYTQKPIDRDLLIAVMLRHKAK